MEMGDERDGGSRRDIFTCLVKSQAEVEGRRGGVEVRVQRSPWSVLACRAGDCAGNISSRFQFPLEINRLNVLG